MKDKELRKLLDEKGIIRTIDDNGLISRYGGFQFQDLSNLKKETTLACNSLQREIEDLQDQLSAMNKHYGITVEKPADEYVVTIDE